MKLYNVHNKTSSLSYAGLLEKIEIIRSKLSWAQQLDRPEIQKLLNQCNALQDEVMQLSHKERFVDVSAIQKTRKNASDAERRQALMERSFIFEGVFGENPKLLAALEIAEKAAPTDLPVLIDGESGTGKELMAKVIHANGRRADKPLISVNCGAIPDNLFESELFGHKRGAFTGASSDRQGKFESANGGTIFLDEIGELPLQSQVKLLRVLQSNEIQRVGSDDLIEVDARVVAATNKNLRQQSQEGRFREDLFYRLSVIQVTVPALRERADEIPLLTKFFCLEAAESLDRPPIQFTPRLERFLNRYDYPGNIRELRNIIYRLSCLAGDKADIDMLPEDIRPQKKSLAGPIDSEGLLDSSLSEVKKTASDEAEKLYLENGLSEVKGRVAELARRTGMNRSHLQTLLKKHGIQSKSFRKSSHTKESQPGST
jgi:DNA-binding NtrC family response regulator